MRKITAYSSLSLVKFRKKIGTECKRKVNLNHEISDKMAYLQWNEQVKFFGE